MMETIHEPLHTTPKMIKKWLCKKKGVNTMFKINTTYTMSVYICGAKE